MQDQLLSIKLIWDFIHFGSKLPEIVNLFGSLFPTWEYVGSNWKLEIPITYTMSVSDKGSASSSATIVIECEKDLISLKSGNTTGTKASVNSWKCDGYYHTSTGKISFSNPNFTSGENIEDFNISLTISGYVSHSETGRYNNSGSDGYGSATINISSKDGKISISPSSTNVCSWGTGTTSDPGWISSSFIVNGFSLK